MDFIYSKIFLDSYKMSLHEGKMRNGKIENAFKTENLEELEVALRNFVVSILGFRFNNTYDLGELRIYFDNICNNMPESSEKSLSELINEYKDFYLKLIDKHPYIKLFTEVIKKIFDKEYNGKLGAQRSRFVYTSDNAEAILRHNRKANSLIIAKMIRPTTTPLPSVFINNMDYTESVLKNFIEAVKKSDTYYNIFNNELYNVFSEEDKIRLVFEGVILNATANDLANLDLFFLRYTEFVSDDILGSIKGAEYIGNAFDDEMYFMVKRSDFEYETPYYLSFMLKNHRLELPNVRLGISKEKKSAYIMAVQTSQMTGNNLEIDELIKSYIPRTKSFNYYNPTHLASVIIAFGFLNGIGINNIDVIDYMPIRYYKTIQDKSMDPDEADNYLTRVTDKNINTYFKIECLTQGVEISQFPSEGSGMKIKLDKEIICHNEFFQHLYDLGYNYGQKFGTQGISR